MGHSSIALRVATSKRFSASLILLGTVSVPRFVPFAAEGGAPGGAALYRLQESPLPLDGHHPGYYETLGVAGGFGPHAYTAAKFGVVGLTKSVALSLQSAELE